MRAQRHWYAPFLLAYLVSPWASWAFPPNDHIHFRQFSSDDGLSRGTANAIIQDHRGFLWIATEKGLHFFDGQRFQVYRHAPSEKSSLSHNEVTALLEDSEHSLWIGTTDGLNLRTDSRDHFVSYKQSPSNEQADYINHITSLAHGQPDELWIGTAGAGLFRFNKSHLKFESIEFPPNTLKDDSWLHVLCLHQSRDGWIWIGTKDDGLFSIDPSNLEIVHFSTDSTRDNALPNATVRAIQETEEGTIWIGTEAGIGVLDRSSGTFDHHEHVPGQPHSLPSPYIDSIIQDSEQNIWIGTDGGGLCVWKESTQSFHSYRSRPYDSSAISSDSIRAIMEDSEGDLWLTHFPSGISHANRLDAGFRVKKHIPGDPLSLSNNSVKGFAEDTNGNVWISTDGGGLNYWDRTNDTFKAYQHHAEDPSSISAQEVLGIAIDSNDTLWAGTWRGGLNQFTPNETKFTTYASDGSKQSLSDPNLFTVLVDHSDTVWAGSLMGLNRLNREKGTFTQYLPDPEDDTSLSNHEIWTLHEGSKQDLWIGTRMGVCRYNRATDNFTRFATRTGKPDGLRNAWISSILEASDGRLWLGTHGGGLHRFYPEKSRYEAITEAHGLADNFVCGILEDDLQRLWISTYNGISNYDPKTRKIRNYGSSNGLPGAQFNRFSAHLRLSNGQLLFGSTEGFVWFDPREIQNQQEPAPLYLTSLSILNQEVTPESHPKLIESTLWNLRELRLNSHESMIRFRFSSPIYRSADSIRLKYKLEGHDDQWRHSGQDLVAEYPKLPPGEFVLRAVSLNADGIPSPQEWELKITILPSLVESTWFRGLCFIAFTIPIMMFHRSRINTLKRHSQEINASNKRLREEITSRKATEEELETARQLAVVSNQAKSLFLANMSHEIRTPLNGIIGLTDIMLEEELTQEQREMLEMVQSSGNTLLTLINDILDFSKIESGEIELEETQTNVRTIIEDSIDVCSLAIGEKKLDLVYYVDPDVPEHLLSDPTRLRQIISNLLSNGVKFTESGEVAIEVSSEYQGDHVYKLNFLIRDTGIGIPKEGIERLFRSFSQVDASTTRKYGGSGLGLTISKRLVELLGGSISIESEEGVGSKFHFTILAKEIPNSEDEQASTSSSFKRLNGTNLLVVDGNETRLKMIQASVEAHGMNVYPVQSSRDAASLQRKFCSAFDLIVLDAAFSIKDDFLLSIFTNRASKKNELLVIQTKGQSMGFQNDEHSAMARVPKPVRRHKLLKTLEELLAD